MKLIMLVSAVIFLITGCGGGGGTVGSTENSGSSASVANQNSINTSQSIFGPELASLSFQYYRDGSKSNPVSYMYPKDIDGDGIDEIFFVSFETQPNTASQYSNTSIHIVGWENGVFKDLTSRWLSGTSNQVEGVGDLCFGDFNGDGKLDVFLSAYTDMNYSVHPYALMNQGGSFTKVSFPLQTWMHAVTCADVNRDGYDDVLVTGYSGFPQYMGSSTGLVERQGMVGGSGIAAGDFLGDGTVQAIVVDSDGGTPSKDTRLFALDFGATTIGFREVSRLPGPRLDIQFADPANPNSSHDIRARAVDFNQDGKLDVVVFGYRFNATDAYTLHRSEIQFLQNKGNGVFDDVTDAIRVGYDTSGYPGYFPVFRDYNGDGRPDLMASQPDWSPTGYHSTSLLVQAPDGRFVDTAKSELNALIESGGGQAVMAKGPAGVFYLVKESAWKGDGWTRVSIHSATFKP